MSYYKNRQEWFDKERRSKLVLAIIEKADKQDRELIPAYNRFIETGDEKMFQLFNEFLNLMDTRQRADKMKEESKRLQEWTEQYTRAKARFDEYYNDRLEARAELCAKIDAMPNEENTCIVSHFLDFICKATVGKRGWGSKRLYINVDGDMKYVTGITITDNEQFVLNISDTKPQKPPF